MLSATLQQGLGEYGVGAKIRALRLKKKMGLVELGKHTGLSPALLSKIERGRLFPTLPTLLRIALVFSVGLEFFFAGSRDSRSWRWSASAIASRCRSVRARDRSAIASSRSTFRRPSGASTRMSPSSCRWRPRACGGTTIRASSSSTPCRAR